MEASGCVKGEESSALPFVRVRVQNAGGSSFPAFPSQRKCLIRSRSIEILTDWLILSLNGSRPCSVPLMVTLSLFYTLSPTLIAKTVLNNSRLSFPPCSQRQAPSHPPHLPAPCFLLILSIPLAPASSCNHPLKTSLEHW